MLACLSPAELRKLERLSEKLAAHYESLNIYPSARAELEDLNA